MGKAYMIFDFFKEAYHINKDNRVLYRPQIIFIFLKLLMIIAIGLKLYSWIGSFDLNTIEALSTNDVLGFALSYGFAIIAILIIYSIISIVFESGIYNMYKECILKASTQTRDFYEGVKKYFFKFLLGNIIIFLVWLIISPLFILLGIITLFIGFTVIPMIVSIFLTMWKVSIVFNNNGIFAAFKDSFIFAKKNFLPLTLLQLIHWSFVKGTLSSGGGGGGGSGFSSASNLGQSVGNPIPFLYGGPINEQEFFNTFLKVLKIVIAILIPVISIATAVASLVKMIFEVFFSLAIFVAYNRGFKEKETSLEKEVTAVTK